MSGSASAGEQRISVEKRCTDVLTEHFGKHEARKPPLLQPFAPEPDALFAPFFAGNGNKADDADETTGDQNAPFVPCRPVPPNQHGQSLPSLLLYDLENAGHKDKPVYKHIDKRKDEGAMMLYGTSGAGKTRSIFEYLSHNKGFYFVAADFFKNPGSKDLVAIFEREFGEPACDRTHSQYSTSRSHANLEAIGDRVELLLYVRLLVHRFITEQLGKNITPYEWLLYQLYPMIFLGSDVFEDAVMSCIIDKTVDTSTAAIARVEEAKKAEEWSFAAVPFIDEAQVYLEQYKEYFLSGDGTEMRSAFSALLKAFVRRHYKVGFPVFSGTGMSLDDFRAQAASGMAKMELCLPEEDRFLSFAPLSAEGVTQYLLRFLTLDEEHGIRNAVVKHVANWLRGRPRFTATFIEAYLVKKQKQSDEEFEHRSRGNFKSEEESRVMEGLDRYIAAMTTDPRDDRRYSGTGSSSSTAWACISKVYHKKPPPKNSLEPTSRTLNELVQTAVFKFAIGDGPTTIFQHTKELIEIGVCAISQQPTRHGNEEVYAELDEPIVVQAGINFYDLGIYLREELDRQPTGENYEKLLLPCLIAKEKRLHRIIGSQLADFQHDFNDYVVSLKSAYGILARNCKRNDIVRETNDSSNESGDDAAVRTSIEKTLQWIDESISAEFEGQVAPFCLPDDHLGCDVLFLLRKLNYEEDFKLFCTTMIQGKYFRDNLDQKGALLTLVPDLLYHQERKAKTPKISKLLKGESKKKWDKLKPELLKSPCLRFMNQYPVKASVMAQPGRIHRNEHECCSNGPACQEEHDYLIVVSGNNADQFFSKSELCALDNAKPPPKKKSKRSGDEG